MSSRRYFLNQLGRGTAMATIATATPLKAAGDWIDRIGNDVKPFVIGIIGAENSHTAGYGKLFNIDKAFPGMEVKYVWGETDAFAKKAMEKGNIPIQVKDPKELLGKIDGLIVDHRHGKYHLEAALPFIEGGIPTFIDKPFCYRAAAGKEFLALAKKRGTPVTSFSSVAQSYATFDIMDQLPELEPIDQVVRYGPVDLESEYGGVFFYGPHTIQPLIYYFGNNVSRVRVQKNGGNSTASLVFNNGMMASLIFTTKNYGWRTFIQNANGIAELQSRVADKQPEKNYLDMVTMFRTGVEPRSHESIIHGVAVLEALEKSVNSERWEDVPTYDQI